MSPSIQPLFRAQPDPDRLPTPTRPRYTLLRIGIQNIWEYDITTRFVARDGRLLLRGQNESGKTKAVEVSLPAVLDAILRAERLDPFGEQARTMRENLIGPHTDEDATVVAGYVWAEFGRLTEQGQPQYQTAGYGVRASRNASGFTSWFFLTGLRPDLDLHLFVDGRPRSQRELDEVLGPQGEVFGGHGDHRAAVNRYRAAVNRALFGFEEMAQFDNLLTLLIELRRPQLAKQLKASDLSRMLTTSLPSLDVNLITKVAEGVDRLEEHRAALEALRETRRTVAGFNITYRRYLQTVVAERTAVVRGATTRVDETARALKGTQATLQAAKHAMQAASTRRRDLRVEEGRLRARVETIKDSDAYRATKDLDDAKRRAVEAAKDQAQVEARLGREQKELADAVTGRDRLDTAVRERARQVAGTSEDASAAARPAALHDDQRQAGALVGAGDLDGAEAVIQTAVAGLRDRIGELSPYDEALAEGIRQAGNAQQRRDMLAEQAAEARTEAVRADAAVTTATAELREAVRTWTEHLDELPLDADLRDELDVVQVDRVRELVDDAASTHRAALDEQLADVGALLRHATEDRDRLGGEREQLEREEYPQPPAPPWRQRRPDCSGAPLYLLGAFRGGNLTGQQQAAVEAALEAAQLLDAWVHPDGTVEHPSHDVQLRPQPNPEPAGSLLAVIEPAAAEAVREPVARSVLASIGLGPSDRDTWVDVDGRFRVGRLNGQSSKPYAQYLGRSIRERNRQRRLAELAELIKDADALVTDLIARRDRLRARLRTVDSDLRRFPPLRPVTDARATAAEADRHARRLQGQAVDAETRLNALREQVTARAYTRDRIAATVGLTLWAGRLGDLARLVGSYERAATAWIYEERRLLEARERLELADQLVVRAESRCDGTEVELDDRRAALASAEERVATMQQIVDDPTGQEVLGRLEAAEGHLEAVRGQLEELEGRWDGLVEAVARADSAASSRHGEHERARTQRSTAVDAFKRLATAGVVRHAAEVRDWPDTPVVDWSETAALLVARRIADALEKVAYDDAARNRAATNLTRAFQELTVALPPELQVVPRTEHDVAIYSVVYDAQERSLFELAELLQADVRARERRISEEDVRIIDEFLSGEIRDNVRRTLLEARRLVDRINADLETRTTPSGQTVNLDWRIDEDAPVGTSEAVELLLTTPGVNRKKDEALRQFLKERLEQARTDTREATVRDRLIDLLDYRLWHRFTVMQRRSPQERWTPLTRRIHGKGSGGSKAATLHLPLFAAAAAFYASSRPTAPRLVVLDEAFAGIDGPTTAKLLDLTVEWDFDLFMTSWREWMCFPELPGLSIYEIIRDADAHVVDTEWFIWDGTSRQEMAS